MATTRAPLYFFERQVRKSPLTPKKRSSRGVSARRGAEEAHAISDASIPDARLSFRRRADHAAARGSVLARPDGFPV